MNGNKEKVIIENTKFIFRTNFAGDPTKDTYGSSDRKCNIIIPTRELADELVARGFNVKETTPKDENDIPKLFIAAKANYESEWPPKIYLVSGDAAPVLLDEFTVGKIDNAYVLNVKAILNPYYSERNRTWSFYIDVMYVEQDVAADPWAAEYANRR